ncbi:UxaA family hydrolase, partial [Bradyrhizobium canariense]|uniref:UxaA family hydrolase n=1 Tax=Bradyrhizobium canariense TaxID=255045 RepID=UPI0019130B16
FVPQGHKLALVEIAKDQPIIRYGEIIGYAIDAIAAGDWVEEARIHMPDAPELDRLDIATAIPAPQEPLTGYTFEGFRNPDGSVGVKNILAISTSVQCVAGTLEFAIRKIKTELLPRYPNVDDVVAVTHGYGCGVAINAPDAYI